MPTINLHRGSIEKTFSLCSQADHVHVVGSKIPAILFLPALLESYLRRRSIDAESPLKSRVASYSSVETENCFPGRCPLENVFHARLPASISRNRGNFDPL